MNCRTAVTPLLLCAMLAACATHPPARPDTAVGPADEQAMVRRMQALLPAGVLLLGEQHDAPAHHQLQRAAVRALAARGTLAAVALEMADQGSSTAGLPPDATEAQAQAALNWNDAGWPWQAYGPVVMAAVAAGVPVLGANLERARLKDAMKQIALDDHLTLGAREKQQENIRDGHCGLLPPSQIVPMARVQTARDAAMARTVTAARQAGKTVLLIAGNGHIDRVLGVPTHLGRDIDYKSMALVPDRAADAAGALAADAVWLTPAPPPRDYCADMRRHLPAAR